MNLNVMPVITPAFPAMNAAERVSEINRRILRTEFRRAVEKVGLVEQGKAKWAEVYSPFKFFHQFRHLLRFDFLGMDEETFGSFVRWTELRLPLLLEEFQSMEDSVSVRPWPHRIPFPHADWPFAQAVFIGLKFHYEKAEKVNEKFCFDLRQPVVRFVDEVTNWPDKDRYPERYEMLVRHQRRKELPWALGHGDSGGGQLTGGPTGPAAVLEEEPGIGSNVLGEGTGGMIASASGRYQ